MSNYRNYVEDFPNRCREILRLAGPGAEKHGLDVTLLLMAASTALTVPYERLKPEGKRLQPMQDRTQYERAAAQLDQLLNQPFLHSPLWTVGSVSSWASGTLNSVQGTPDRWPELRNPLPPDTEKVSSVLSAIRNALAHGNLYMQSGMRREIIAIVFVTGLADRKTGKADGEHPLRFLQVTPPDLRMFLDNWFGFVAQLDLPLGVVVETLNAA